MRSFYFATCVLLLTVNCFAHQGHDDHGHNCAHGHHAHEHQTHEHQTHEHDCSHGSHEHPQATSDIHELGHFLHHAIGGEHHHYNSFADWLSSFAHKEGWAAWVRTFRNLPRLPVNYRRALLWEEKNESQSGREFSEHAKNLAALYGMGEVVEVAVIGPVGTWLSVNYIDNPAWQVFLSGASWLTSVPGVEPVCGLLVGCYLGSSTVRHGVGYLRKGTMKVYSSTLGQLVGQLTTVKNPIEMLEQSLRTSQQIGQYELRLKATTDKLTYELWRDEMPLVNWRFARDEHIYLQEIIFSHSAFDSMEQGFETVTRGLAKIFGKNVELVTYDAYRTRGFAHIEKPYYVDYTENVQGDDLPVIKVVFTKRVVDVPDQRWLKPDRAIHRYFKTCVQLLK